MKQRPVVAGIGALAFSVLTIIALLITNPPGGSYSEHDATKFVSHGHHAAVFVAVYLVMLAIVGLICLLAYLRDVTLAALEGELITRIFWGTGLAAAACIAAGWGIVFGNAIAHAFGGKGVVIAPPVTYLVSELGSALIWGPGAFLLGIALIVLMVGSRGAWPAWLRWATLIAGLGGVASVAFFPSALVILWGIVVGIWLLAAQPTVARAEGGAA
jgi:hypothetical protein